MNRQPQIDEIVSYLQQRDPLLLQKIRLENPAYAELFKEGITLGEPDSEDFDNELRARAKICFAMVEITIRKCNEILPGWSSKIKSSNKLQLYGQIITAISGASVITTLAADVKSMTYVSGGLGLLGSLVPLIVDSKRQGVEKNKKIDETYIAVVKLKLEVERHKQELQFFIENDFNVKGISDVINRCNQLCFEIEEKHLLS
jgi:hypothetical protein